MDDVVVLKAADHMDDGVHFPDVGKELVAEPLAFGRALDEAGDVDEFDGSRHHAFRVVQLRQKIEALIRHRDDAHVGLDGAERIVRGLRPRVRDGIEQRALPDVGKADDPKFHDEDFLL